MTVTVLGGPQIARASTIGDLLQQQNIFDGVIPVFKKDGPSSFAIPRVQVLPICVLSTAEPAIQRRPPNIGVHDGICC